MNPDDEQDAQDISIGNRASGDVIETGNIEGVGIAIGTGASVRIYGDVHYYPIKLRAPLRSQFAPLIEDRTRLFGGRLRLFDQIGQFIADPAGGYLVVTAPAGFGKTTLMANLVSRTPQAFAYHFFSPLYSSESLNEDFFLRNVVEQMAQWHGHTEQLPERLDELRALYQQFLAEPLERTQVMVLDGLDEVRGWRLAPYLSRQLPPNLHLVLTVRDVGQDWRGDYSLPADQVTHLPLEGLTRDDVVQVLKAAGQSTVAFVDEPQLLDEVMRVSAYPEDATLGADPFYVRILAEDIASGQLQVETLSQQSPGLNAYLDKWWQDIRTAAGDTPTRDLFGTLAVALGPIARTDLETLNPSLVDSWDADFFQGVISKVRRFIIGDERGYALIHPRLRQYMRRKIKNTQDYLDKLLAYCADWQRYRSPYALTYYAQHLARAAQALTDPSQRLTRREFADVLDRLIVTSNFHQAVIELFHSPQPFFDDLRLGLELALDEEDLVQAWRYVARYRQVLQDEGRPDRVIAEVGASNYDAALDRTALYGSLPNSQGMLRLWIAWCAAAAKQTEIATRVASLTLRSLPASGFVSKAAEVADPEAADTIRDAVSTTLQRLLLRLAWAITDTRASQAVWLRQVAATWPPRVVDELSRRLDESPATWIGEFGAPTPNLVLDDLLDSLTATTADNPMNFREAAFGYQRELAAALYQERTNPSWQMRVEQVVRKLSLDDYPSYREMALAWVAAAVLCHDDDAEARRALSTILTGALGIPEPGFGGDTVVAALEGLAQESGKILKTDGLADVLKRTPAPGTTKEMTQIDLRSQADLRSDPWAFDLLSRSAVAAALHRQGRQSEAECVLEQAENIGVVGSYAGYRVLARLSLACRWLQWGKPDRARDLLALSRSDADNMLDKVLGTERMGLIDALAQWIADFEQRALQLLGDSTAVDSVGDLTGMKRSLRIQFLAALWSQSPMSLKRLVPLALADTTSLDSVLGRLFASLAVQGLPGQPFHRLGSEMGVLHLADTFVVNR